MTDTWSEGATRRVCEPKFQAGDAVVGKMHCSRFHPSLVNGREYRVRDYQLTFAETFEYDLDVGVWIAEEWLVDANERMDIIARNGNTGEHYKVNKYRRGLPEGKTWVDVYDVLELFDVKSHALGHAIKKLLMAGNRGHKDYQTDLNEAVEAIKREIKD